MKLTQEEKEYMNNIENASNACITISAIIATCIFLWLVAKNIIISNPANIIEFISLVAILILIFLCCLYATMKIYFLLVPFRYKYLILKRDDKL